MKMRLCYLMARLRFKPSNWVKRRLKQSLSIRAVSFESVSDFGGEPGGS
jgi:hypothetical protein